VATISRLLKVIGLFCRISSLLYVSFAKETYNFKEPTNRSHISDATCSFLFSFTVRILVCCSVLQCVAVCCSMLQRVLQRVCCDLVVSVCVCEG